MKKTFLSILFLLITFISCNQLLDSKKVEVLERKDFDVVSVNDLYQIEIPSYMKKKTNLNEEASLQYANFFKETYIVVFDENKQDFIDIYTEFEEYDKAKTVLKNYEEGQIASFNESIENLEVVPQGNLKIKDLDAAQYLLKGTVDNIKIQYLITLIEGNENIYMLMSWTIDSRMNKYLNTFKQTHNSFQLK